ncbi:hypothetical protein ACP70R_007966 [Stipagrostis hirtigluma subsp. patula]
MGKTTLAKKIFNDREIQAQFKSKIWLSVTESYNEEKLLSSAIIQAGGEPRGDKQILTQILTDILSTGKFLFVLDDIWSDRPWTGILQRPAVYAARNQPQPGSRVIVTTRNEGIVKQMGAAYHLHHVKPMHDGDAWVLLKKQLLVQVRGITTTEWTFHTRTSAPAGLQSVLINYQRRLNTLGHRSVIKPPIAGANGRYQCRLYRGNGTDTSIKHRY